jgi:tetrahydromethanopterin S-methyltransferase subunit B
LAVQRMARSISVEDQPRLVLVDHEHRGEHPRYDVPGRSGNAIVGVVMGVAFSAVLWLVLALFVLLVFWR